MPQRDDKAPVPHLEGGAGSRQLAANSHVPTEADPLVHDQAAAEVARRLGAHGEYSHVLVDRFGEKAADNTHYEQYLGHRNQAQRSFTELVPLVLAFLRQRIAENYGEESALFDLTEAEIATTYLAEGGDSALAHNKTERVGYTGLFDLDDDMKGLGKHSWMHAKIGAWLHPSVRAFMKENQDDDRATFNNANQAVSLYANAAVYACCKAEVARALYAPPLRIALKELTEPTQFFWTTLCFTAGPGGMRSLLHRHGLDPAGESWNDVYGPEGSWQKHRDPNHYLVGSATGQPVPAKGERFGNPYYEALRRTAALEALEQRRPSEGK
jgi:hypothetical protein